MNRSFLPLLRFCSLIGALALLGCSKPTTIEENPSKNNLRKIAQAYQQAAMKSKAPLKDVNDLKPMLQTLGNPDELLRSPNDGENYVIIFGVDHPQVAMMKKMAEKKKATPEEMKLMEENIFIAYEKRGKNGKRYAVTPNGGVIELTDAEFAESKFVGNHKPQ